MRECCMLSESAVHDCCLENWQKVLEGEASGPAIERFCAVSLNQRKLLNFCAGKWEKTEAAILL